MRDARFPERTLAELMKSTRRRLAEEVIKLREQASHPYITRLEQENAALLAEVERLREIARALVDGAADYWNEEWPKCWVCAICLGESESSRIADRTIAHEETCLVIKARALLEDTKNGG